MPVTASLLEDVRKHYESSQHPLSPKRVREIQALLQKRDPEAVRIFRAPSRGIVYRAVTRLLPREAKAVLKSMRTVGPPEAGVHRFMGGNYEPHAGRLGTCWTLNPKVLPSAHSKYQFWHYNDTGDFPDDDSDEAIEAWNQLHQSQQLLTLYLRANLSDNTAIFNPDILPSVVGMKQYSYQREVMLIGTVKLHSCTGFYWTRYPIEGVTEEGHFLASAKRSEQALTALRPTKKG